MKTLTLAAIALTLTAGTASAAANDSITKTATLTGAVEVPQGDPDGAGSASVVLKPKEGQICWTVSSSNIEKPTAAHIHTAPAGAAGPPVLPLDPVDKGCAKGKDDLIKAIEKDPAAYYVNVHTADFPKGAIRGQLAK